jgi:hypothetical protein
VKKKKKMDDLFAVKRKGPLLKTAGWVIVTFTLLGLLLFGSHKMKRTLEFSEKRKMVGTRLVVLGSLLFIWFVPFAIYLTKWGMRPHADIDLVVPLFKDAKSTWNQILCGISGLSAMTFFVVGVTLLQLDVVVVSQPLTSDVTSDATSDATSSEGSSSSTPSSQVLKTGASQVKAVQDLWKVPPQKTEILKGPLEPLESTFTASWGPGKDLPWKKFSKVQVEEDSKVTAFLKKPCLSQSANFNFHPGVVWKDGILKVTETSPWKVLVVVFYALQIDQHGTLENVPLPKIVKDVSSSSSSTTTPKKIKTQSQLFATHLSTIDVDPSLQKKFVELCSFAL